MTEQRRLTLEDVAAARKEIMQIHERIRTEGEEAVVRDNWDAVIDELANLPEVQEMLTRAEQFANSPRPIVDTVGEDEAEEEAIHQAVVKLVQDAQRMAEQLRTAGERDQRPA